MLSDFVEAGVSEELYPKIYRTLPTERGKVKETFSDIGRLKRHWIDKALLSLYEEAIVAPCTVVVFTWVMPPGLGDWSAQQEIASLLKRRYPFLNVQLVTLFHKSVGVLLESIHPSFLIAYDNHLDLHCFTQEVWDLLRSATFILQAPTYYPYTDQLLTEIRKNHPHPPLHELIGEYGFVDSPFFHPKTSARSLGLHFLEKGVLIKDVSATLSLEHKSLNRWLLEGRAAQHRFYFAYLITDRGMRVYFQAIILLLRNEERSLDFCFTDIGFFLRKKEEMIAFLKECGVREVLFFFKEECYELRIQDKGKKVRIAQAPPLCAADFAYLVHCSDTPVGCRGDQSFSLCVSLNKAFFYDPPQHARAFLHDLVALAEHRAPEYPALIDLFKLCLQLLEPIDEKKLAHTMAQLLVDPELAHGFEHLAKIVHEEHSCNAFLTQLTARAILHCTHPEKALKEEAAVQLFLKEEIAFKTLVQQVKNLL